MHTDKGKAVSAPVRRLHAWKPQPQAVSRQMRFSEAEQTAEHAAAPPSATWAVIHPARKVVLCTAQKGTQSIRTDLSAY